MRNRTLVIPEHPTMAFIFPVWAIAFLWAIYCARAVWIARKQWSRYETDVRLFYLLVAPLLTLATDILLITDRLFWREPVTDRGEIWPREPSRTKRNPRPLTPIRGR